MEEADADGPAGAGRGVRAGRRGAARPAPRRRPGGRLPGRVGPIPRRRLLEALRDSLAWHGAHEPALQQSVLNACRGWRFTEEGVWSSKDDAGAWALHRTDAPALVEAALAVRHGDRSHTLDPARVDAFQRRVLDRVEQALKQEG